jgi:hypothetical protein
MAEKAGLPLEEDAAEIQGTPLRMRVHVQTDSDPYIGHC